MIWTFEHSAESGAAPADLWPRYVDVEHWSEWSKHGVAWSRLDGPFEVGTRGTSKPSGLPAGRFRLVDVVPERRFATDTRLPGARLQFEHLIEPLGAGTRITHRARIEGPLSRLYVWILGRRIRRSLPDGVERLATTSAG